ncbi:hypothetical protein HBI56_122790 [Parastagonospora nodorum]|uniref:Uncharacterized protein n=1 Tax=Phaeosphaeria nodorum (strain SN15 / ATCC MYA-4574 / FGSC 10173) TaxID=321614 RepID=A0A7U2I570_PHANO|nr:hypothetical protein HBH56_051890 [Parastagonospora nodorum]QRD02134.1 hypothetical protein JI435_417580 [Parastagonospora nodorum SN15]KAH3935764.1 hypothetical protein HBH54_037680 [Parastagonospora nodorum]KAH3948581.1 hypothetical protein HBH53_101480 [Parastagonospora nodorum]KAH3970134.1 hypothetical protein HBH51_117650 [Parastagonospora nodorum]
MASKLIDGSHASRLNLSPRRYPHPTHLLIAAHRSISNAIEYDSYRVGKSTGIISADLPRISCRPLVSCLHADIGLVPLSNTDISYAREKGVSAVTRILYSSSSLN